MKPILGRTEARLLVLSAVGLALGVASSLIWIPRATAAWGRGPRTIGARAAAVAEAFHLGKFRDTVPALCRTSDGPVWVSTWRSEGQTTTVVLEPTGALVGARQQPSTLAFNAPQEEVRAWLEALSESLPSDIGRMAPVQSGQGPLTATLQRPDGVALTLTPSPVGVAGSLEIRSEAPISEPQKNLRFPAALSVLVALGAMVLAAPHLWKTVSDGRARPGSAASLGTGVLAAALIGYLALAMSAGVSHERLLISVAMAGAMAAVVVAGQMLVSGRPEFRPRALHREVRAGWMLGGTALGLASVGMLVPHAAAYGLSAARMPGLPLFTAALLGSACGVFVEEGLRVIVDEAFPSGRLPVRLAATCAAAAVAVAGVLPGPWWWSLLLMILAAVGSGVVAHRFGRTAAAVVLSMFIGACIALPGLATSTAGALTSIAALVVCAAGPALVLRCTSSGDDEASPRPPAYVQALAEAARRSYIDEVAVDLQSPLCVTAPALEHGHDVACVIRRARPPASDLCRIVAIGRDRLGVILGDVPGGGVQGSVQASILSAAAVTSVTETKNLTGLPSDVERVIATVWSGSGDTVSLSVGILDRRSKSFSFVNAGHQPLLLYRALAGRFERISPPGTPLKTTAPEGKRAYEVASVQLVTKDLLIFFSDGLLEIPRGGNRFFSAEDLEALVLKTPTASCTEMAHAVDETLDRLLAGRPPRDDVMVLFLRAK